MQGNHPYGQGQTAPAQGQPAQQPAGGYGRVEIHTSHNPLAWILFLVSTGVEIDGYAQKVPWGRSGYDLAAGVHNIRVYYNYLFGPAGIAQKQVQVYAGYTTTLTYAAPLFTFSSGNLVEMQPAPMQQLPPPGQY